ncbi:MAG TPA: glycine zipper 2TM domain-containing protein [Caulobacteraceae bacterium]|jgi:uncharacterized protein YcfJ|nr:glycine zipper 2TM domain-containing protein [Caulobacteraceae bacterium]
MRNFTVTFSAAALAISLLAVPDFSQAKTRHMRQPVRHASTSCVRHKANNGTAIGAVGGGLLGNVIAGHGSRTAGTVVGAGVGAVAGHQIAKSRARSRC